MPLLSLILQTSHTAWGRASLLISVPRALGETSEAASVAPCSCQDQWWNLSQWRIRDQSTWLSNRSVCELPSHCSLIPQPCHLSGGNNCGHLEHPICLPAREVRGRLTTAYHTFLVLPHNPKDLEEWLPPVPLQPILHTKAHSRDHKSWHLFLWHYPCDFYISQHARSHHWARRCN